MDYNTCTPAGTIYIASCDDEIIRIDTKRDRFLKDIGAFGKVEKGNSGILDKAIYQMKLYFNRKLKKFDLPMHFDGTPFQRAVWSELMKIPYGTTTTYVDIAEFIGKPKAARAVGGAVGANPIPFVIPCHRVIGKDGSLVGFGLGLDVKKFLLELESAE